jgi:hypothetical protein
MSARAIRFDRASGDVHLADATVIEAWDFDSQRRARVRSGASTLLLIFLALDVRVGDRLEVWGELVSAHGSGAAIWVRDARIVGAA